MGRISLWWPLLSAAMIVRDEAEFLAGCLRSLQSVPDEVIVVDTGSTDETPAITQLMARSSTPTE